MSVQRSESRWIWLGLGLFAGLSVAQFWPHEPVYAVATHGDDRFAICTVPVTPVGPVGVGEPEAVFVLDNLTGRLTGAWMNTQAAKFTNFYQRSIAEDFRTGGGSAKMRFLVIPGQGGFTNSNGGSQARAQTASGVIYVAEQTSGKVGAYGFYYSLSGQAGKLNVEPIDSFSFRGTPGAQ